jgi:GntR family transcriptional regulator
MLLNLTEHSDEPLQGQIARQIRAKILAGDLPEGEALPSIRALASEQRVSVITVQRAYERLERDGLIQSRQRRGFFVAPISDASKKKRAEQHLQEQIEPFIRNALAEGLTAQAIAQIVEQLLATKKTH